MDSTIIVAVLSLLGTFGGSLLGVMQANKLVIYRLSELEKKVEKHNTLVERMALAEKDIRLANQTIDDYRTELRQLSEKSR